MATYYRDGQLVSDSSLSPTSQLALQSAGATGGGGFTQASTGGINLQTGMPLNSFSVQQMNQPGFTRTGLNTGYLSVAPGGNGNTPEENARLAAGNALSASNSFMGGASVSTPLTSTGRTVSVAPNAGATANTAALGGLIASYQRAAADAKAQSLAQYDALMKSVSGTTADVNKYLADLGVSGNKRIDTAEQAALGSTEQDLVSRGLGNTTIRNSLRGGVRRDAEDKRQQLNEGISAQKIGTTMGLGQMYGDALLSRVNQGPDNSYLAMIQQLAASGGGGSRSSGFAYSGK